MFRCSQCVRVVPPGTPLYRLVAEYREKKYPRREKVNLVIQRDKNPKAQWVDDPGGTGFEIVKEIGVCPDCAKTVPAAPSPYRKSKTTKGRLPRKGKKKPKAKESFWDK